MNDYNRDQSEDVEYTRRVPQSSKRARAHTKTKKQIAKRNVRIGMAFFSLTLVYLELIVRVFTFKEMHFWQFVLMLLFSVSAGSLISLACSFIKNKKALKIVYAVVLGAISVIYSAQLVYYKFFNSFFSWDTVGMAGQLKYFYRETIKVIFLSLFKIILLFIPFILLLVFFKRFSVYKKFPRVEKFRLTALTVLPFLLAIFIIVCDHSDGGFFFTYNHPSDNINSTAMDFGVLTSTRLGLKSLIFGEKLPDGGNIDVPGSIDNPFETKDPDQTTSGGDTAEPGDSTDGTDQPVPSVSYGDNVMDIDFASLIASAPNNTIRDMHEYFSSVTPTKKNKYTGYFKGKNLIYMTLEGFSGKVIDPELTPTLYKMSTTGFVTDNFYNSCWGGSTATGEYANMTGLFYNNAKCLEMSAQVKLPFCLGNQFSKLGYLTNAYHSNTYTYYSRNVSHPNMGYNFIAQGTGIEDLVAADGTKMNVKSWPQSDHELAKVTLPTLIKNQPFHAYYMTISGHCYYSWSGNKMSAKHKAEVENLNYSEEVKAYIACQLEVEYMLREMVEELDAAGILEDTVFVMTADHYPYGLADESLAELYNLPVENIHAQFDLYRNTCIIWSAGMKETVHITSPCSVIDILPTVSNLFGLEYDSRFLPGTDLLSDTDPRVILNCDGAGPYWCWINKYGEYNSKTGFTPYPEYANTDENQMKVYVTSMTKLAAAKKTYTFQILTQNYFSYVFK